MAKKRKKLTPAEREQFRVEREQADMHIRELRDLAERALAALPPEERPNLPPYPDVPPGATPTPSQRAALREREAANSRWLRELADRA